MKSLVIALTFCCVILVAAVQLSESLPRLRDEEDDSVDDYNDSNLERLLQNTLQKRSCIRRGGNCDHRRGDCCYNSSCRCNLWSTNCRCQRAGLFQNWGK